MGELYHLSPSKGVSVSDVVKLICTRMDRDFEQATRTVGERPGQDAAYLVDSTKAFREFGWRPEVAMEQGIDEVIGWVNEYWGEISRQPLEYRHSA